MCLFIRLGQADTRAEQDFATQGLLGGQEPQPHVMEQQHQAAQGLPGQGADAMGMAHYYDQATQGLLGGQSRSSASSFMATTNGGGEDPSGGTRTSASASTGVNLLCCYSN